MDDDALIQNRYAMRGLLDQLPAIYEQTKRAYEFVPGSYSCDVMRNLGALVHEARQLTGES